MALLRFFFGLFFFLFFPVQIYAQTQNGISVSPAYQEVELKSEQAQVEFSYTNLSDETLQLSFRAIDLKPEDNGQLNLFRNLQGIYPYHLANYLSLSSDSLTLEPKSSQKISVRVNNREDLSPGGHYGAILSSLVPLTDEVKNIQAAVSPVVIVRKTSGEIKDFRLQDLKIDSASIVKFPQSVLLQFENIGNVHLQPRGLVTITDIFGQTVLQVPINEESSYLFPDTKREFRVKLQKTSTYWPIMKYWVTAQGSDMEETVYFDKNQVFIYIQPLVILVLLGFLAILAIIIKRHRNKI